MGLFERFFGRRDKKSSDRSPLVANPAVENPLSLQILFAEPPALDSAALTKSLRGLHTGMAEGAVEFDPETVAQGTPLGLAGWGDHVVKAVGFNVPMPPEVVERTVGPSHYGPELKEQARAHRAHMLLYYAGHNSDTLEQYVALAAVAAVLAGQGAVVVLNESAHTSFPAAALAGARTSGDALELLRQLPLLVLYCGFVKYNVDGVDGVWMRTYGAHLFGQPDLAARAEGHHEGEKYFEIFGNVLSYLLESGARFEAGHTMQVGADTFMRLRAPAEEEYFLQSEGELFVAEMISADEINR